MTDRTATPEEGDLRSALLALRANHPTLGLAKLHTALLESQTTWLVSEKRVRKVLQDSPTTANESAPDGDPSAPAALEMVPSTASEPASSKKKKKKPAKKKVDENVPEPGRHYPESREIEGLDLSQWTDKVKVHNFGRAKGKGLVARVPLAEGEVIWKEDPWAIAPEWDLYDLQLKSRVCGHCTTPLSLDGPLVIACPAMTSTSFCPFRFCNRMCARRADAVHPLLCPARNPASVPLREFVRVAQGGWQTLYAYVNSVARLLLATQTGQEEAWRKEWSMFQALAVLDMEERAKDDWMAGQRPDRALWKKAHQLLVRTFRDAPSDADKKKLAKIFKRPIPTELDSELLSYEGFLRGLGRMSLNLEVHGGLYVLYSHINHSCAPNLSARHIDQRTALSRVTLIARAPIKPGEELTITYVDPDRSLPARRRQLREWGFGACWCERCKQEEKEMRERGEDPEGGEADKMADELKQGLGLM